MSGPSTKREDINAAPIPGLTPNIQNLLQQFSQGQNPFQQWGQPSGLQQQAGNIWGNYLSQPSGLQRTTDQFQQIYGNASPEGVIGAAQPIFQRNLQLGADTLRQAGPRFASNTERLVQEQGQRGIQDFNLFAQQAQESARNQQLQALMGQTGAQQGAFGGFGGFANQMQGQQLGFQQNLFNQLFGGLLNSGIGPAVLTQNPGSRQAILQAMGQLGGSAIGAFASSSRFKEDIQTLGHIEGLRLVSFRYKGTPETRVGMIAEEVAERYPQAVAYDAEGAPWGIYYGMLGALLEAA